MFAERLASSAWEPIQLLLAVLILLTSAHAFGRLFVWFKLPRVIGEIAGGLVLGPTGLGSFAPAVHASLFESNLLSVLSWLGLILLMFFAGLEVQKTISQDDRRMVVALLLGATAIPCLAGWLASSFFDFSPYAGTHSHPLALKIIIAVSVAVTSIPVISKIFLDLKIAHTRFAKIVLTTATVQDVLLWMGLAVATGIVGTQSLGPLQIATSILVTLGFFVVALFLAPAVIERFSCGPLGVVRSSPLGYTFSIAFVFVGVASVLNVNIVFAGLLAGILAGTTSSQPTQATHRPVQRAAMAVFIPIYFGVVGLKLDLINHFDLVFFLAFLLLTSLLEICGSILGLKCLGKDWFSSLNFGVAMNARGGPGIVLATIAFETGIINQTFFSVLVLTAIVTSLLTGCWLRWVLAGNRPLLREAL